VFAFAVTLLVVSLEVPRPCRTGADDARFRSFCVAFVAVVYDLVLSVQISFRVTDCKTTQRSGSTRRCFFLVLFYVYPLKFFSLSRTLRWADTERYDCERQHRAMVEGNQLASLLWFLVWATLLSLRVHTASLYPTAGECGSR